MLGDVVRWARPITTRSTPHRRDDVLYTRRFIGERFPEAQFLITGLLGPKSNAHGPNEFLHIETGKRLTCCVAQVLEDHFER